MIKKNKAIVGVLLFTMLLSGIPEGFGIVSDVYAAETAASAEEAEGPEAPEENVTGTMSADSGTEDKPETAAQTPGAEDPDEANPSGDGEKITEGQGSSEGQVADEKSSGTVEDTDKKEDTPAGQGKETDDQASVAPKEEQNGEQKDTQEDARKEESQKDNDTVKTEKEYPAFKQSKTINGVIVTVEADAGVFPENAKLSVTSVSSSKTEKEVNKERDDDQNVAVSYTFDIKVLDENGNELQPAEDQNVKVSFRTAEVADPNLEVSVYHISEDGEGAEELDVDVSGQTAVAESDGFSYYTVEFTYNNLQYVLAGGESVPLSEILSAVGLVGEATEVTVSNSALFSASKENGKWMITAHKAFTSEEWMRVTINGAVYEITVTDNQAASGTCGENLTWTLASGTLTISGTGAMTDWGLWYNVPWCNKKGDITKVVIESDVTTIGINAFYECEKLTSVKIPSTVTSIGGGAFYKCSSLTSVDIAASSNLTSIGERAFFGCTSLQSIEIPSGVTSIGQSAFNSCTKLEFAVLKGTIDVAGSGDYVFGNCDTGDNKLLVYYKGYNFDDVKRKFSIQNMTNTFTISYSKSLRHEYDGSAYSPMPTVYYGQALEEGKDYTLSYQKNIDAGVWEDVEKAADVKDVGFYRVVAKGVEGTYYDGMITYGTYDGGSFTITPKAVIVKAQDKTFAYDGNAHSWPEYDVTGLVGADSIEATVTGSISSISQSPVANVVESYRFKSGTPENYTVTTQNGRLTMTENERKSYSVMVISPIGGMAKADKTKGTEGESVKLSAKADKGYDFKEWKVEAGGVDLSDRKSANATFRIKTADVQVIAVFAKKKDSDDDDHDDTSSASSDGNNYKVPDGCDELRSNLASAIALAASSGTEQTIKWDKGTALPYDVMKMLQDNPKITLEFSYTYQNQNYKVTIPGKNVIANPAILWYGPLYLYMLYGDNKTPAFTTSAGTYTVKSGDTLSAIAKRLKTTLKHLKDINNIKNVDKIKPGMVLRY